MLACQDTATGAFVGLLLHRRVDSEIGLRYHVGVTVRGAQLWMRLRYHLAPVDWALTGRLGAACVLARRQPDCHVPKVAW
ncbi:hypothetical protein TRAPUB_2676 [Trametes pubescens]|uniref:Uncharacterized protein n=1 Tax=Trametes pubescens TaxID=154538 RepID=A0A1M2VFU2_TRAPU|nr:hypothetical protein TRAPUB_2676 [Trametes pubescens]